MHRLPFFVCLLVLAAHPSLASAQGGKHVESALGWNGAPVTDSTMSVRLRDAALEYRQYAPIPRIALYDLAYPAGAQEYARLGGNGVLLVTAVVQDSSELPAAQVYVRDPALGDRELRRIGLACGRLAPSETGIAAVFGRYRCDALYAIPLVLRVGNGQLLVDFAVHRQGFRLLQFDGQLPQQLTGVRVAEPTAVADSAFRAFLAREYPGLAARVLQP